MVSATVTSCYMIIESICNIMVAGTRLITGESKDHKTGKEGQYSDHKRDQRRTPQPRKNPKRNSIFWIQTRTLSTKRKNRISHAHKMASFQVKPTRLVTTETILNTREENQKALTMIPSFVVVF
jgi:hypothetical protein